MLETNIEQKYQELKKVLQKHSHNYYVLDNPQITDQEYDVLYNQLLIYEKDYPELLTPDSPSQRVGDKALDNFSKIVHENPLYSLDNAMSDEDLIDFDKRICNSLDVTEIDYVGELKIDGLAISLIYEKGIFIRGATRGDGTTGEDVTLNLKTIKSLPLNLNNISSEKIPEKLEVRGEVFLSKKNFALLNEELEKKGQKKLSNPRNTASGALKQLNPNITSKKNLDIFIYAGIVSSEIELKTHYEMLEYLKKLGFKINENAKICKGLNDVKDFCSFWKEKRAELEYETDGIVIKANSFETQRVMGFTSKSPKWAIAYKYPAQQGITKIENILVQIGRLGTLTPVAVLTPINLAGSTISRATLHNLDEKQKDLNNSLII